MKWLITITAGAGLLAGCSDQSRLLAPEAEVGFANVEAAMSVAAHGTTADAAILDALERILPEFGGGAAAWRMAAALEAVAEHLTRSRGAALTGSLRSADAALDNLAHSAAAGMDAEIEAIRLALDEAAGR